jgi:hypothetical protein
MEGASVDDLDISALCRRLVLRKSPPVSGITIDLEDAGKSLQYPLSM